MAKYYTKLNGSTSDFNSMMSNGFGIVTVMNAKVYDALSEQEYKGKTAYDIVAQLEQNQKAKCTLETLKVANITMDGPSKTINGGQYNNFLIKFGKTARLEMQDALGTSKSLEVFGGALPEYSDNIDGTVSGLHFGSDFSSPVAIVGDSFFIDRKTGEQVPVKIIFYQFLADSIENITQDAEGDATVFDLNGDLLNTTILVGSKDGTTMQHSAFYSIIDPKNSGQALYTIKDADGKRTITLATGYTGTLDTVAIGPDANTLEVGKSYRLVIKNDKQEVVLDKVVFGPDK